jgi:deoxyadenosine/deoxycytidine kinase
MEVTQSEDKRFPYTTPLFAVLGNIGSGKSTVVDSLGKKYGMFCKTIPEPVDKWVKSGFLEAYYNDMKTHAFTFQLYAFATRSETFKEPDHSEHIMRICDGHVINDREVFAQVLNKDGFISDQQLTWYDEIYNGWQKLVPEMLPAYWIYLRTRPEVCLERINKRNRSSELGEEKKNSITLSYLKELDAYYEKLITSSPDIVDRVLVIDNNQEEEKIIEEIHAFIMKISHEFKVQTETSELMKNANLCAIQ